MRYFVLKGPRGRLLVLPPDWRGGRLPEGALVALLPEGCRPSLRADWVVSYGLAESSTLTFSSLDPAGPVLSLQREVPTLTGEILDRQELPIGPQPGARPEEILCTAGALLVAGLPPEKLNELL